MKLSLKIASIFTMMTAITILLYLVSSNVMVDYLYQGEMSRISGISGGVINRVEGEEEKFIGKVKDYAVTLETIADIEEERELDFREKLGLYDKFKEDGIEYKMLLSPSLEVQEIYGAKEKLAISDTECTYLQEVIIGLIDEKKPFTQDIINTQDRPYWVAIDTLKSEKSSQHLGYLIGIKAIDQEMLASIAESMGKDISLVTEIEQSRGVNTQQSQEQEIMIVYNEDHISSYFELKGKHSEEDYYIKIMEPLVVKQSTKKNIDLFTTILIGLCIIINLILAILIEKLVVKRIIKINRGVNEIKNSTNLSERIVVDSTKDEIGSLENDINEMFEALEDANESISIKESQYSDVLATMTNGFAYYRIKQDEKGRYIDGICEVFNDALAKLVEVNKEDMIGKYFTEFLDNTYMGAIKLQEVFEQVSSTNQPFIVNQIRIRENKWVDLSIYVTQEGYFTLIVNDVTKLKQYLTEMKYLAEYDSLTNLKNRHSLYRHLNAMRRVNKPFVIYFMDLDNFKTLNDTVGHVEGDKVLCHVANGLMKLSDSSVCIGRVGGDEFVLIKEGLYTNQEILDYGEEIIRVVNQRFEYALYNFEIKVSIGVSIYPHQAVDVNTLLKYGDIAMYRSKKNGGNSTYIFADAMMEDLEIEARLKDAIDNNEIVPYYQPILDIKNEKIVGAEALARWKKDGEIIQPDKFIPVAKNTGYIVDIDYMILERACEFCKQWNEKGVDDFTISVNLSYRSLKKSNCVETIKELLSRYNLKPDLLKLEITEDDVLEYPQYIIKVLNEIKLLGIKVALDDFGVGYSLFNHIKMLPIDILKIDRSILLEVGEDTKTRAIVESLINLAHTLNLEVICEGVEDAKQMQVLKAIDCDMIQGYFISQPVEEKIFGECIQYYNIGRSGKNII
ncbi:MAG: EAL domain-containing protein [Niameybacter sp.]